MLSSGYRLDGRPAEERTAEAIPIDGDFVTSFGQLAKELDMAIGLTLLERHSGRATQHDGFIRPIRGKS